ncbi:MAG: hypothetical protein JOZ05_14690 [Acetobacteraceae bacterium]|nr:hypothetical protein [Acetobacteraceae bacterium]
MRFPSILTTMLPLALLAGCATPQQRVADREDLLAAAGFVARPANTPQRAAMLASLPPDRFTRRTRGSSFVYVFPDPLVCSCIYFGDEVAYGRYRQEVLQRRIANEQLLAAQINEQTAWDWGPWGPLW